MADDHNAGRLDLGDSDEPIIEGTALVMHVAVPDKRIQATVVPTRDREKGLDNIIIESPKLDRAAAFYAVVTYIVARSANPHHKILLKGALLGQKAVYKRDGLRHHFVFNGEDGEPVAAYYVTLIEV
jgi:hypothetical protein